MLLRNTGIQQMFEKCLLQDFYRIFLYDIQHFDISHSDLKWWGKPFLIERPQPLFIQFPICKSLPPPRTRFRINSQFVDHDFNSLIMLDPSLISTESLCNPQSVTNSFEAKESRNDVILFFLSPILFQKIIQ